MFYTFPRLPFSNCVECKTFGVHLGVPAGIRGDLIPWVVKLTLRNDVLVVERPNCSDRLVTKCNRLKEYGIRVL